MILFAGINMAAYSQVIVGTVYETGTNNTISSSTIYFDGAFAGTLTDKDGKFSLDVTKYAALPLTISSIGYFSVTLTNYPTDKPLKIYLTPKVYELNEVLVTSKSLARKRKEYMKLFKEEFLGTTYNADNCEIINENDISFNYDSSKDTVRAFASNPIIINNLALGYKITCYLDKFEYYKQDNSFLLRGNFVFNEDMAKDGPDKNLSAKIYEQRRFSTYPGSRMHFFRALWKNGLEEEGFSIKNSDNKFLSYEDVVKQDVNNPLNSPDNKIKYINYEGDLIIYYYDEVTTLKLLKPRVYFYIDGKYDSTATTWEGEMIKKRIGDMLPDVYIETVSK